MRIAIDYSAAVNQRAGVGRLVRNQVLALADVDHTNEYRLVFARPNHGSLLPQFPKARNFSRREVWPARALADDTVAPCQGALAG